MNYPRVLTIAGSDSGGGAGIQADIKAISATGSYASSAITALTVQNTQGVSAVHNVPLDIIEGQITAVLDDIGADAVKIGMLSCTDVVLCVRKALLSHGVTNIILDPVMVATSGDRLIDEDAIHVLSEDLIPMARVITPNIPEAEILSGLEVTSNSQLPDLARLLSKNYSGDGHNVSVLMKAGHLEDEKLIDYFYNAEEDRLTRLESHRVNTRNTHGTGCTLSSAMASYIAQGYGLDQAAAKAKEYISKAIEAGAGYEIGKGHGPVKHFWMI